jgi:MFS transporter, ACS family, tartrate transporter
MSRPRQKKLSQKFAKSSDCSRIRTAFSRSRTPLDTALERTESAVISRLMWRLMPFLFLLYIVAYLDRINVGFAVLQMKGQLGLDDLVIGRAAGIFFLGYFFFQLPSNLILEKFGVRRWISLLMAAWGVISCLMIFIHGPVSFYLLRFLLGAAEAGFFPGMILYMKRWFPAQARARAVAWFMTANPIAGVVGSPVSGALLNLHSAGLSGWQWMFLMEGLPAIILGAIVFSTLPDRPHDASWLPTDQRDWLLGTLAREQQVEANVTQSGVWQVLFSVRIWMLSVVYFAVPAVMYGVTLWLPSVIRSLAGLSYSMTGLVAMIPFVVTTAAMVLVGLHSDRKAERRWHTAVPAFASAAALVLAAYSRSPVLVVAGLALGMAAAESMVGPLWAMATSSMEGLPAAAGIAMINSLANLGGYFGPYIIGFFRKVGGDFRGGLLAIAGAAVLSGFVALIMGRVGKPAS